MFGGVVMMRGVFVGSTLWDCGGCCWDFCECLWDCCEVCGEWHGLFSWIVVICCWDCS